jgi:hypothetical protein
MYEEIILRQKRAELEGFAERQRLLKEAGLESLGFRHRLAVLLLSAARRLEPQLAQEYTSTETC